MVDYHRIGNIEGRIGNAASTTRWHQSHWWKSPRWIVNRIEALAVVAFIFGFLLVAFGSCRRWSNSWIIQKGFFAAQVLSLSLGTYSIGLMQSSSVKSDMYPIWTVSLFTLFGCIDPVTTYNGLDYMGPLSKVVYRICLSFGYVLLMSISTIYNVVGNTAIITLSGITFVKSFHRSFALVQQNNMRDMLYNFNEYYGEASIIRRRHLTLNDERPYIIVDPDNDVRQSDIELSIRKNTDDRLQSCYDVCNALYLSQKLQRHLIGLEYRLPVPNKLKDIDYKLALKVTEIELAFIYDALFTGNQFFHYYQAKTTSLWALASFIGICFVGVTATIPRRMTSRRPDASGDCTRVVDTTTADLAITLGMLVSLALLQLTQLVLSWTSNWARAAVAYAYARKDKKVSLERGVMKSWWMRLKVFVATSTNQIDNYLWLWQDKISQLSMLPEPRLLTGWKIKGEGISSSDQSPTSTRVQGSPEIKGEGISSSDQSPTSTRVQGSPGEPKRGRCVYLVQILGLHYIWLVIRELLSSDTNKRGGVKLDEDVKASIYDPERISASEIEHEGICSSERGGERISASSEREGERKSSNTKGEWIRKRCAHFVQMLGLHYIWLVIRELLSSLTNKRGGVKLDEDVKRSVIDFLGQIKSNRLDGNWLLSLPEDPRIRHFLAYFDDPELLTKPGAQCYRYTSCVMTWHIVTWYCELEEQTERQEEAPRGCGRETAARYLRKAAAAILGDCFQRRISLEELAGTNPHQRVAKALSQYCVYLVKSAPELLPGPVARTKRVYDRFSDDIKEIKAYIMKPSDNHDICPTQWYSSSSYGDPCVHDSNLEHPIPNALILAKLVRQSASDKLWETLARVWVQLLVYAAPYGKVEAHMRHLALGGEFITHLWALLYHLDIREWKVQRKNLTEITTLEDADKVLAEDGQAVVAYLHGGYLLDSSHDELTTASGLEGDVRYYYTTVSRVAEHFRIKRDKLPDLAFLKKEANNRKPVFYDGEFRAYDIARFVTAKKIDLAPNQAPTQSSKGQPRTERARD